MVQKEKQRERSTDLSDISDSLGSSSSTRSVSKGSLPKRLYNAVMKEGDAGEGLLAGLGGILLGAIAGGVIPLIPGFVALVIGFTGMGALMGKMFPDGEFSTLGGVGVASTLMFVLSIGFSLPLGLGMIPALVLAAVATGGATWAHQKVAESDNGY